MRYGGALRHGCHGQLQGNGRPENRPNHEREQQEISVMRSESPDCSHHCDEHPRSACPVSPSRSSDLTHPFEREYKQDCRKHVQISHYRVHYCFSPRLPFLNIRRMRSVIMNPLMTLVAASATLMVANINIKLSLACAMTMRAA